MYSDNPTDGGVPNKPHGERGYWSDNERTPTPTCAAVSSSERPSTPSGGSGGDDQRSVVLRLERAPAGAQPAAISHGERPLFSGEITDIPGVNLAPLGADASITLIELSALNNEPEPRREPARMNISMNVAALRKNATVTSVDAALAPLRDLSWGKLIRELPNTVGGLGSLTDAEITNVYAALHIDELDSTQELVFRRKLLAMVLGVDVDVAKDV